MSLGAIRTAPSLEVSAAHNEEIRSEKQEEKLPLFDITPRQFAHRVAPAYLEGTKIVGIDTVNSLSHWMRLITRWLNHEALFFPLNIKRQDLEHLFKVLEKYQTTLKRHLATNPDECEATAQATLQSIQSTLEKDGIDYFPSGYTYGVKNRGHSLPVKLVKQKKEIEALILNLGAGVDMHPVLGISCGENKFHFLSFPAFVDPKTLFGEKGLDVFTRLIRLLVVPCPGGVRPYSPEDSYGLIYSMGTIQSHYQSKLADRASKPQLGDICGDMAATLLVTDVLIDRSYPKITIQRLFCLEQLCNILFYHQRLVAKFHELDDWLLLENGIRECALQGSRARQEVLSEQEVDLFHDHLKPIALETQERVAQLKKPTLSPFKNAPQELSDLIFRLVPNPVQIDAIPAPHGHHTDDAATLSIPRIIPPHVAEVAITLQSWTQMAQDLSSGGEPLKAHQFVYRALLSLEIPKPNGTDFWDRISEKEIPLIIEALVLLARYGIRHEQMHRHTLLYPNHLILLTGYAIVDKLARRTQAKYLKGFASPFYPARSRKAYYSIFEDLLSYSKAYEKKGFFEFRWLPTQKANLHWSEIRYYFESVQNENSHTLFAVGTHNVDLQEGVKDFRKISTTYVSWTPVKEHLKFLEPFLEHIEDRKATLQEQFLLLWLNENNRYIPEEIEALYFFAHYSWLSFHQKLPKISSNRVLREKTSYGDITLSEPVTRKIPTGNQSNLNEHIDPILETLTVPGQVHVTENHSQCLTSHDSFWNTPLYRKWARIFSNPQLQVTSLIQWMRNNLSLMSKQEIQFGIERGLLQPGLLVEKIQAEPNILDQLRDVVSIGIRQFGDSPTHVDTFLFFIRLGLCCETFAAPTSIPILKRYEALLLERIQKGGDRYVLFTHLLFLYQTALPNGSDSLRELIKAEFWISHSEPEEKHQNALPEWLCLEAAAPLERYYEDVQKAFLLPHWGARTVNELIHLLIPKAALPQAACQSAFPILSCGEYRIHLVDRKMFRNSFELIFLHKHLRESLEITKTPLVWAKEGKFCSSDGLVQVQRGPDSLLIPTRQFPQLKPYADVEFQKTTIEPKWLCNSLLTDSNRFDFWTYAYLTVICKKNESVPCYLMFTSHHETQVYQITSEGKRGLQLVNIWKNHHPLADWFARLGALEGACVWANPDTGMIEAFDILDLDLSFKATKNGFRCSHPDLLLAEDQTIKELEPFTGAIALKQDSHRHVLLPARTFAKNENDFSAQVSLETDFFSSLNQVFHFQLDAVTGTLMSSDPGANLYLTLLFALQRNYSKALYYLHFSRPFQHLPISHAQALQAFYDLKDKSPEALAFCLHVAIHVLRNHHQVILTGYSSERTTPRAKNLQADFFKWAGGQFEKYLRVHSTKEICRIPSYIRLKPDEELFLLESLKPALTLEDANLIETLHSKLPVPPSWVQGAMQAINPKQHWNPSFDIRYHMLRSGKYLWHIDGKYYPLFPPDLVFLLLQDLSRVTARPPAFAPPDRPLPPLVRYTTEDLQTHFVALYQRAQQGKAECDIFFLMRSGDMGSEIYAVYSHILRYVQNHPTEFQDLHFTPDPEKNKEVLIAIVKKMDSFFAKLWNNASLLSTVTFSQTVYFSYQKSTELTVSASPVLKPLRWGIEAIDRQLLQSRYRSVYTLFQDHYFQSDLIPFIHPETPFPFAEPDLKTENYSTSQLVSRLKIGHEALKDPKQGRLVYALREGVILDDCWNEASSSVRKCEQEIFRIKTAAETLANSYPKTDYRIGLRKLGKDLPEITLDGILTQAYLAQNPMVIRKANPSLHPKQIYQLLILTMEYHIVRLHRHQLKRGLEAIEKYKSIQPFAESIATQGDYDLTSEPEMLVYQSREGKSLRPKQADLMVWEIETTPPPPTPARKHLRLFSAPAGEGKTTLYIPIAMKRLSRLGFVPFSVSTKALYEVDRKGLQDVSQRVFSFEIAVLEMILNTDLTAEDCKWFYEQLTLPVERGFKIIPEMYDAIDLKYALALDEEDVEKVRWLHLTLEYFEAKGALLIDEGRLNCSPFTQAKIGIGKPKSLPPLDRKVFLEIYRVFVSPALKNTVRIAENMQSMMKESERAAVRLTALQELISSPLLAIPPAEQETVKGYWLGKSGEPAWFQKGASQEQIRASELIKIYFDVFFETAMQLVWRMQHVRSLREDEEIHVPARDRQATTSYFDEAYLTLIATVQGVIQEGLSIVQAENLYLALETAHAHEVGNSTQVSEIEKNFRKWTDKSELRLCDFTVASQASLEQFHSIVSRNSEVILWYLEHVILKQIQFSPEYICVTPVHFLHAFAHVTVFSADPGPDEIYGIYTPGKHVHKDPQFLAHAVHQSLQVKNSQFLEFPPLQSADHFFNSLLASESDIFSHLRMISDMGGMLRKFLVPDIVKAFFEMLKLKPAIGLDGLIIFEEASDKESATKLFLWLKGNDKPEEIVGHDVPAAIRLMGHNWDQLKLLTIIDPNHRAGANIRHHENTSILVLLGEGLTLSNDAQGKLRGRGVLNGEQRIIWGIAEKLARTIATPIKPYSATLWEMRNDAKITDTETLLSAYQWIDFWIELAARQEIRSQKKPEDQIATWKKHRKGLVHSAKTDPVERFKAPKQKGNTDTILGQYAEERYRTFAYRTPWQNAKALHQKLAPIIEAAQKRNSQLTVAHTVDSRRHTSVYINQKEEMKKEYAASAHYDLRAEPLVPLPNGLNISKSAFIGRMREHSVTAQNLFGSPHFSPNLYFTQGALTTAKTGNTSLKETYLKPIQHLLVMEECQQWIAFALSDHEAAFFQNELLQHQAGGNCHLALVSADGHLVQNGKGTTAFLPALLQHPTFQDFMIDVGLARCELHFPVRFLERIEKWNDFWPMWQKLKQWQPLTYQAGAQEVEKHVPATLKQSRPPPAQTPNFFVSLLKGTFLS